MFIIPIITIRCLFFTNRNQAYYHPMSRMPESVNTEIGNELTSGEKRNEAISELLETEQTFVSRLMTAYKVTKIIPTI